MLVAPDIENAHILECLKKEYGVVASKIEFLPLGADANTAVYRVVAGSGAAYFLKLRRKHFHPGVVAIPHWLAQVGMDALISPIATTSSGSLWTHLKGAQDEEFTAILSPFVEGKSGWEVELSKLQWETLGKGLKMLHTAALPSELAHTLPQEEYSPVWRKRVLAFLEQTALKQAANRASGSANGLFEFLLEKQSIIEHIVMRAEELASVLMREPPEKCLCHGDIHAGNVLIDATGQLFIVDWDTLILAPKERDLMFIGGGVGGVWNKKRENQWFYQGYDNTDLNLTVLTYYRYERIVQDIAESSEELTATDCSSEDRVVMMEQLSSQFEPGNVVDIAFATDRLLQEG